MSEDTVKNLNLKDRLLLRRLIFPEGNIIEMILLKDLVAKIELTPEEITKYSIRMENENIVWNKEMPDIPISFSKEIINSLVSYAKKLSMQNSLTIELIILLEKLGILDLVREIS